MKIISVALGALFLCRQALASIRAGPYNFVYYFSIYRAEIDIYGRGETWTANLCKGSLSDESCNFDEFCKYVKHGGATWNNNPPDTGEDTNIGNNVTPDPHTAANRVRARLSPINFDYRQLLKEGTFTTGNTPNFAQFIGEGVKTLEALKEEATTEQMTTIKGHLDNVVASFKAIRAERVADMHQHLYKKLETINNLTIKPVTATTPGGFSYQAVKLEDTLTASPGLTEAIRNQVKELYTEATTGANNPHVKALNALDNLNNRLSGACGVVNAG
jgi:hypothetical protein